MDAMRKNARSFFILARKHIVCRCITRRSKSREVRFHFWANAFKCNYTDPIFQASQNELHAISTRLHKVSQGLTRHLASQCLTYVLQYARTFVRFDFASTSLRPRFDLASMYVTYVCPQYVSYVCPQYVTYFAFSMYVCTYVCPCESAREKARKRSRIFGFFVCESAREKLRKRSLFNAYRHDIDT